MLMGVHLLYVIIYGMAHEVDNSKCVECVWLPVLTGKINLFGNSTESM